MIRALHRTRGASAVGARGPGDVGPFGRYGALEDVEPDDDLDGQDDEQQDHKLPAATAADEPKQGEAR